MSADPITVARALGKELPASAASDSVHFRRLPIFCTFTAVAFLIVFLLGKDLPWDTLNYHLYAGYSAIHDRFSQDYFAAGPQSYFNPYAYVPFYLLVRLQLSSLQISAILVIFQSSILWITYELAIRVSAASDVRTRIVAGLCAVAMALANPILIQEFGSSFTDITTGEMVLGGWLLLVCAVRAPRLTFVVWAGVIIGVATALKLTNSVHAMASFVVLAFLPLGLRVRTRFVATYAVALAAGFVIASAPWSYRLQHAFGNPIFPLANGIFRSPDFITQSLANYRFTPTGLLDALARPFQIVRPDFMVQEEMRAPDLRYAILAVLVVVVLVCTLWGLRGRIALEATSVPGMEDQSTRVAQRLLAALGCGLAVDWAAWLIASGNGRYFIPMACISGVVTVELLFRLLRRHRKVLVYSLVAIFGAQGLQLTMGSEFRWNAQQWDAEWLNVHVPKPLATQPALYLSVGVQSDSFLAAYLPSGSGLSNFAGSYLLEPYGANGAHLKGLIRKFSPHVRVLLAGTRLYGDNEHGSPRLSDTNELMAPFGLRVDVSDCQIITVNNLSQDLQLTYVKSDKPTPRSAQHFLSCALEQGGPLPSGVVIEQREADLVLDRLEDACPQLFQPRRLLSRPFGHAGWMRYYVNTDEMAWVSRGWVKFDDPVNGDGLSFLGRESDWLKVPQRVSCGRRHGHYFAKLL